MRQGESKKIWVKLLPLIWRVEQAFSVVGENAQRLADRKRKNLCDVSPDGPLGQLARQAAEVARDAEALLNAGAEVLDRYDPALRSNPLALFSDAVNALRWLAGKCGKKEPSEFGDEVKWLLPSSKFSFMYYSDGEHTISCDLNGDTTGITRAYLAGLLASRCQEGRKEAHKLTKLVKKELRVCAAEERAEELEIIARANIISQVKEGTKTLEKKIDAATNDMVEGHAQLSGKIDDVRNGIEGRKITTRRSEDLVKFCKRVDKLITFCNGSALQVGEAITKAWKNTPGLHQNLSFSRKKADYDLWVGLKKRLGREPTVGEYEAVRPRRGRPPKRQSPPSGAGKP